MLVERDARTEPKPAPPILEHGVGSEEWLVELEAVKRSRLPVETGETQIIAGPERSLPIFIDGEDRVTSYAALPLPFLPIVLEFSGAGIEPVQPASICAEPNSPRPIDVNRAHVILVQRIVAAGTLPPSPKGQDLGR